MTMRWLRRLGRSMFTSADEETVGRELRLHAEMEADDLIRSGVPPAEARRRALVALGGVERFRDEARDTRGVPCVSAAARDLRYSIRALTRVPAFTSVVVLTLGLGIGANTAFFSILNALVLRPLPVHDPGAIVALDGDAWTNPIWEQIRDRQAQILDGVFAWSPDFFDLASGGQTDPVEGAYVSGDLFRVMGVSADQGRVLTLSDDRRGGGPDGPVAVISHRLWQSRFGARRDVIGSALTVERVTFTIVGVMPRSFFGLDVGRSFDLMIPMGTEPLVRGTNSMLDARSAWWLYIGGRLAPGQTLEEAQAALRSVQPQIRAATIPPDFPPHAAEQYLTDPLVLVEAATGRSDARSTYQPALVAIMAVVGLVLLIACANVASLMLARATTRHRELGVRLALGASRARIAAQLLTESLLLSAAGAAFGLLVAVWGGALVVRQLTTWRGAVFLDLSPDWRVFGFLVAVSALTALIFGLAPAWRVRASSPQDALRQGGRAMTGDRRIGVRDAMVVTQLALSLVLLVAAGLFLRTFVTLSQTPVGMDTGSLLVIEMNLAKSATPPEDRYSQVERLRQAVASVPGVASTAASVVTPLSGRGWNTAMGPGMPSRDRMSWMNAVSPGWFATVGAQVRAGRDFTTADAGGVAIVNEAFASRFLRPGPVPGQTFETSGPRGVAEVFEVVGMASDVMYRSPREGMVPTIFVPVGPERTASSLFVRFSPGHTPVVSRAIADELRRQDSRASFTFRSFEDLVSATVIRERVTAALSVAFGALALLLAAIGLYGVMSYGVSRRRPEIAVRMALGADRSAILRLIVGRGSALVAAGILTGVTISWWGSRYLQSLLFELDPRDAGTVAGSIVVLCLAGLAAAWFPARSASRIDPAELLRES